MAGDTLITHLMAILIMAVTGMGTITGIGMDIMLVPEDITLIMIIMDMADIMVTGHQGDHQTMAIMHRILLLEAMNILQEAQGRSMVVQHAVQERVTVRPPTVQKALTDRVAKAKNLLSVVLQVLQGR